MDAKNYSYSISMKHLIIHYNRAYGKKEIERIISSYDWKNKAFPSLLVNLDMDKEAYP
jgi:hypothetical protein